MSQGCAAVTQTVVTWASKSDIWSQFSPDYYNRKSLFAALTKKKGGQIKTTKWWKWRWNTSQLPLFPYFLLFPSASGLMKPNTLKFSKHSLFQPSNSKANMIQFCCHSSCYQLLFKVFKCWFISNYTSAHMLTFSTNNKRSNLEGNIAI